MSKIQLFCEDIQRTDESRIQIGETVHDFFNRSSNPRAEAARRILNKWFADYPPDCKARLLSRFKGATPTDFSGALFELYLYSFLRACRLEVLVEQPTAGGSSPDFLVRSRDGCLCFVEAATIEPDSEDKASDQRFDEMMMQSSRILSRRDIGIVVNDFRVGAGNPSPRRFARFIEQELAEGAGANCITDGSSRARAKEIRYRELKSGWYVRFTLHRTPKPRKEHGSIVLACPGAGGGFVEEQVKAKLRRVVKKKQRQHRGVELPLIVAIATNDFLTAPEEDELRDALFGSVCAGQQSGTGESQSGERNSELVWAARGGRGRIAPIAIIHVNHCYPTGLAESFAVLWRNPWVSARITPHLPIPSRVFDPVVSKFDRLPGRSAAEILGLR